MFTFPFRCKVPQLVGIGVRKLLREKLYEFNCTKVMIVCDEGMMECGIAQEIIDMVQAAGVEYIVYDRVLTDTPDFIVDEAAEIARQYHIDGVVSVGGGSVTDAAKGIKLLQANPGKVMDYFNDFTTPQTPSVPLICLPTTAGAGGEACNGGIITDTARNIKGSIAGEACRCDFALVDPELTLSCPPDLTAACAFDVLAHAVETMTSRKTSLVTQAVSREAIRLFKKSVLECYYNGQNLKARADMHLAGNLCGITLSSAGGSAGHAFAHALGAAYNLSHGVCCAMFLPSYVRWIAGTCPEEILMLAEVLEVKYSIHDSVDEIAKAVAENIYVMTKVLELPNIYSVIPDMEDAYALIPVVKADIQGMNSPRPLTDESCKEFLELVYSYH